jgi:glutamyl-tRNA synthetase
MNGAYIRDLPPALFAARMFPWLEKAGLAPAGDLGNRPAWYEALAPLVAERTKLMPDVVPMVRFLFTHPVEIEAAAAAKTLAQPGIAPALAAAAESLSTVDPWTATRVEEVLRSVPEKLGVKPKILFQAIRVAVTGSLVSLPLFESIALLGRDRTLARLQNAMPTDGL